MALRVASPPPLARPPGVFSGLILHAGKGSGRPARAARLEFPYPVASFAFDGFTADAARTGATLLEKADARGDFYTSASQAGSLSPMGQLFAPEDLQRLVGRGHEIGCATYSWLDCARAGRDTFLQDIVQNGHALGAMGLGERLDAFAYPFGHAGWVAKKALPQRYLSGRGMAPGLASGAADLACLRSNAMYGIGALKRCLLLMDKARRTNGWVIFHAHDVRARPSPWGVPTGLLERLIGAAYTSGMRILTVSAALALAANLGGEPSARTGR